MYDKGTVYYVVQEENLPDRIFAGRAEADTAFREPNLGSKKNLIACTVVAQKVVVRTESEVA